ncbi:hypothetical protein BSG1_04940 [Bacillus sp. SG-1]|nr:hypothetical protein BSG1_04940 [Bacillus sp. SG-1]
MKTILEGIQNIFLDLFAMGKGFIYGFFIVALFFLIGGAILYGFLYIPNLIF